MQDATFIGVYATSELPASFGGTTRPMARKKRLWFVWQNADGSYQAQPLNAIYQPMAEPKRVDALEFGQRYRPEPTCPARPGQKSPELWSRPFDAGLAPHDEPDMPYLFLRADDPNLLYSWLEDPPPPKQFTEELSLSQQVALSRIVEESLPGDMPQPTEEAEQDVNNPLKEEELRAEFASALLLIKVGKRDEGLARLEKLVHSDRVNPYDGQLVFSDFGLNLRKLGFVELALEAHLRALEWLPDDEHVHFNLARTYHDLGRIEPAIEHLRTAIRLAPDFTMALHFLSFLDTKEVEEELRGAIGT